MGLVGCGLVLLYLCGLAVIVVARLVAALVLVYGLLRFVVGLKGFVDGLMYWLFDLVFSVSFAGYCLIVLISLASWWFWWLLCINCCAV